MESASGKVLYHSGPIEVLLTDSAKSAGCQYVSTNESYSIDYYPKLVDKYLACGIIGGGEQLLCLARNPEVHEIIGIDNNLSQIALFMGKISRFHENRSELLKAAKTIWSDKQDLEATLDRYFRSDVKYHAFGPIYEALGKRLNENSLNLKIIAGECTEAFLKLPPKGTVYLSNVPDCFENQGLLLSSLNPFLDAGSTIILCEISSDYYASKVPEFIELMSHNKGYRPTNTIKAFTGGWGETLRETIYVLDKCLA